MKRILLLTAFIATAALATQECKAQLLKTYTPVKDTCVNADTTVIRLDGVTSEVVAFHVKAEKVSGTVAGTATLQGSNDGTNWTAVGSAFTLTNIAHNQTVYEPAKLSWMQYRVQVITSGTCKINGIRAYTLRRTK